MDIDTPERPEPPVPGLIELPDPDPRDHISTAAAQPRIYRIDYLDRIDHLNRIDHPNLADQLL